MSDSLVLIVNIRAKQGMEGRLREALKGLVEPTRAEPGCIHYELHESETNPSLFVFYENWKSRADHGLHRETPHYKAAFKILPDLIEGKNELVELKIVK